MKVYRKLIRPVHCYPGQGYEPKTELVEKEEKWYPEEEREHLEEKYGYLNEGHFSDLIFEEKYEPCLLKEQEEQVQQWTKEIADNQLAHVPDELDRENWDYKKGIWDGLQIAWNIISEGR